MVLPSLPAAVVFDMDGLLFDSERLHRQAARDAATACGGTLPDAVFLSLVGGSATDNQARLAAHFGPGFVLQAFLDTWSRNYAQSCGSGPVLKPGVVEMLDLLDTLRLKRAIATSSSHEAVQRNLAAHGLGDRFHAVVARGDYARGKPAPDPFLLAAARIGVPAACCLALEDSPHGVRAAAAAGMTVVMVPDLVPAGAEEHRHCAFIAPDLMAVAAAIRSRGAT